MQAALIIAQEADLKNFNSRKLAQKSGYALGTLVKRLGSIENIFLWAVKKIREKYSKEFVQQIKDIDKNLTLDAALELIIDKFFIIFKKVNPKTIQYFENRMFKKMALYLISMTIQMLGLLNGLRQLKITKLILLDKCQ